MEKTWVKDVKEGERIKGLFLVARKATPTAKSGKTYLAVTLHDKTGELEARAFDRIEDLAPMFDEKDHVEVEGQIGQFQGKPQLRIESVSKVDLIAAGIDPAEFLWLPPPEPKKPEKTGLGEMEEALWKELQALVEVVADPQVRNLVKAFLEDDDVAARLRRAPAAKSVHHAYPGGLLEHTVSCLKLAHRLADHYPQVDRDLLVAGAFFHDLGKIRELSYERQCEYTDEGRLVGHLVMTAQWIHDKARRIGVPRDLEQHVVHLVLSHHGQLDFGSPKVPMTLEAMITHAIDDLDSRINSWLNIMGAEGGNRRWSDSSNFYGQHIWRGTLPTLQVEKKGPPAELLTPVIYVPREVPAAGARQGPKKARRGGEHGPARPRPRPEAAPSAEPPADAAEKVEPAAAAPQEQADRPSRPERPPRPERPERGPRGGPGDRQKRYMGPRLPGDKGPQPRPKPKETSLTHNPFAALAQKIEGVKEGKPPEAPPPEAPPPAAEPAEAGPAGAEPAQAAQPEEPVAGAEPGTDSPAPEGGGEGPPAS